MDIVYTSVINICGNSDFMNFLCMVTIVRLVWCRCHVVTHQASQSSSWTHIFHSYHIFMCEIGA